MARLTRAHTLWSTLALLALAAQSHALTHANRHETLPTMFSSADCLGPRGKGEQKGLIAVVYGTRPEIIKLAPVVHALTRMGAPFFTVHTGQHYSHNLDRIFIESLDLPEPTVALGVGSGTHGAQTAEIIRRTEEVFLERRPAVVLVQGDTNSVLGAAIACAKLPGIRLGHVEAGLRSHDRTMPEEMNRVIVDHLAHMLFAPTPTARALLVAEGIPDDRIWVTGNTVVDAVQQNLAAAHARANALVSLGLAPKGYFLLTLHRQENVSDGGRLRTIFDAVAACSEAHGKPIVYPIHPRTRHAIAQHGIRLAPCIRVIEPVGYHDLLVLESQARLVLTDSGGLQEEACILGVPCVTLRENTERPETIAVGANHLGGVTPEGIRAGVDEMLLRTGPWPNPFGDGTAGVRIAELAAAAAGVHARAESASTEAA